MADESTNAANMPLVSVLIPAYNHERFVELSLDSVLADPYPNKELVIIDDGSIDATGDIIKAWVARHRDEMPIQFVRRANRGIAATLNELAVRARGALLKPGASDDYLLPGGLDVQVRYLLAHPGKGAVIGDSIVVDSDGNKLHDSGMADLHGADKRLYRSDDGIRRAIITQWAIGGPVALIRKTALDSITRWREGLRIDDWDLFLRLAGRDALGFVDAPVCAYRLHGANFSKTRHVRSRVANLTESQQVALRYVGLFEEPHRSLLKAQAHYIGAKIAYLNRHGFALALHLTAYATLRMLSLLKQPSAGLRQERA